MNGASCSPTTSSVTFWFLWHLVWLVGAFALLAWAAARLGLRLPRLPDRLMVTPALYLWAVPVTMATQYFMGIEGQFPEFGADTFTGLVPAPHVLVYYGVFFAFGAVYFGRNEGGARIGRWWQLTLPLALIVFLAGVVLTFPEEGGAAEGWARWGSLFFQAAYAWMMTLGLMGLFRAALGEGSARARYLSDASYWLYLMHLPLIVVLQGAAQDWALPSVVKLGLLIAVTVGILLLIYEWGVRYTPLGTLLNGRRVRAGRAEGLTAARCSSQGRCLQPGGGSGPADATVWTPVIVIRKEARQRFEPLAVGRVRPLVGPLGLQDLVERLRLAIGLRPEGPRALQPQVSCRRRRGEDAAHVAGAVVGQDALDRETLAFEVGKRPDQESSSAHAAFVRQGLGVGIARVVVYGYVDEVESEARAALRATASLCEPGQDALAATLRDATEFLDIQVNQRARTGMLVANDLPCGAMEPREAVKPGTAQYGVDGGASDAQLPPDAVRAPGKHTACSADGCFLEPSGLAGAA